MWIIGLLVLIVPVVCFLFGIYKENRIDDNVDYFIVDEGNLRYIANKGAYTRFRENYISIALTLMIKRVYLFTYIWSLHVLVLCLSVDLNFLYIFLVVGFTNIAFIFVLRSILDYMYTQNLVALARRMPLIMMINPVYEGMELINIPGVIAGDIVYGIGILLLSFYVFKWFIYIVLNIIIRYAEWLYNSK